MQKHPAPFSEPIIAVLRELMKKEVKARVCDPFGGTGRVLDCVPPNSSVTIIDIEPSFIQEGLARVVTEDAYQALGKVEQLEHIGTLHPRGIKADWYSCDSRVVLRRRRTFTHIITSPSYGNRFKDAFNPTPGRKCRGYAQSVGGPLQEGNTGAYGLASDQYTTINYEVMRAAVNRLIPGGTVIVNVSDFYKTFTKGAEPERQQVVAWWIDLLHDIGLHMYSATPVVTRRFKEGENRHRAEYEIVLVFRKENTDVRTHTR